MTARYAIYFAPPPHSPWWRFGASWLGRDEVRNVPLPQEVPSTFSAGEFAATTSEPRRYGFHATLKAPFALVDSATADDLCARVGQLAATLRPMPVEPLVPLYVDGFVALAPARRQGDVEALASRCVKELDDLRAPLTPQDIARRRPELLDDRGRELLQAWGYPYVLDRFRFHMSLTGPVELSQAARIVPYLAPRALRLEREHPLLLDRLSVFVEPHPGAPFVRLHDEVFAS